MKDTAYRTESDSRGRSRSPPHKYWGAQTQRSNTYFNIGIDYIPEEVIHALAIVKKASAIANEKAKRLDPAISNAICEAADEILDGRLDGNFPLKVWMTGSGTQSNMNLNESSQTARPNCPAASSERKNRFIRMTMSICRSPPTTPFLPQCTSPQEKPSSAGLSLRSANCATHSRRRRRNTIPSSRSGAPICRTPFP